MDLSYILDRIFQEGRETVPSEALDRFKNQVDSAYRQLTQLYPFTELRIDGATTEAVGSQREYVLPPVFDNLVRGSLRYDYTSTQPGHVITGPTAGLLTEAYAGFYSSSYPRSFTIGPGSGGSLYSTGTASINNRSTSVTGSSTTWTSDMAGEWIVFHGASTTGGGVSGVSGYGYGYQIASVVGTTSITLTEPYRGPALSGVRYEIRPSSKRIIFSPTFTEDGRTVIYSYFRKPRRLYNDEDEPEVHGIEDAIVYKVLSMNSQFHRDPNDAGLFQSRFRTAWGAVISSR